MSLFIDPHRDRFGVEPICRALQFAPSTYYARKERERNPCARALRDRELLPEIRRVHEENLLHGACGDIPPVEFEVNYMTELSPK